MHMHPMDTRTTDQEHDYIEDYKSGSSLTALVAIVLVLALLIGAVVVLG